MFKKFIPLVLTLGACAAPSTYAPPTYQIGSPVEASAYKTAITNFAARLPNRNVGPLANCLMQNASKEEISRLAALGPGQASSAVMASIISRPQTGQCISRSVPAGAPRSAPTVTQQPSYQPVYQPVYSPPVIQPPIIMPAPQVAPIQLPGSNTVRCISTGIHTVCR